MVILTQPDTFSFSGNLKKFVLSSEKEVPFVLYHDDKELLSASYTPGTDGRIVIDISQIVEDQLSFTLSDVTGPYTQEKIKGNFRAVIGDQTVAFTALRGGVDRLSATALEFCTHNFLTWQPQIKRVTYATPEYLTYYAASSGLSAVVKAYFTGEDGTVTSQTKTLHTLSGGSVYTLCLQYAYVMSLFASKEPSFYDVWVENAGGERLTYIQRYVASDILSEEEDWILFENSLGGIDTFRAYGQSAFQGKHTHNIAQMGDESQEYYVDTDRTFQKSTGYLTKGDRQWLVDFFPSLHKYIYQDNALRRIVVTEDKTSYIDKELPSEFTFTYRYADARPFLNLQRVEDLPSTLAVQVPNLGSFTIPPRLVEFPVQELSRGILFPVQHPYSEKWGTTTIDAILGIIVDSIVNSESSSAGGVGHVHPNLELLNMLSIVDGYLLYNGIAIKSGMADAVSQKVMDMFLRKDQPDEAAGLIKFLRGLLIGNNGSGIEVLPDGTSQILVDRLHVKIKAYFDSLEIHKKTYVGGSQILSHSGLRCIKVEDMPAVYRCYLKAEEEGIKVENTFTEGSLAYMQEENVIDGVTHAASSRMFWREVAAVGPDYIDLSKQNCLEGSSAPQQGDDIIGLGHKTDADRQAAIFLNSVGKDSPSIIFYQGINSFSLEGKEVIEMKYDKVLGHSVMNVYGDFFVGDRGNDPKSYARYTKEKGIEVKGSIHLEKGSTGASNLADLPDEISRAVQLGTVNLLRNSGFTGNYESSSLDPTTEVDDNTEMYSAPLEHWGGMATVSDDAEAISGKSAAIGSLTQSVQLINDDSYVLSFRAKGANVAVSIGAFNTNQALTAEYQRYSFKFKYNGTGILLLSGTATLCDIQLERGTIVTDWAPSPLDNDKSMAEVVALQYIQDVIKSGSVDILGGLVLASMVQLGNYKDGKMQKVTSGISGIYNNDDDVAVWAGGSYEQAIRTVLKFREDPHYNPTDEEWADLANFVITHGGDAFFRGYIYATGGIFRGKVATSLGGNRIEINPETNSLTMYDKHDMALLDMYFSGDRTGDYVLMEFRKSNAVANNATKSILISPEKISINDEDTKLSTYLSGGGVKTADENDVTHIKELTISGNVLRNTDWPKNNDPYLAKGDVYVGDDNILRVK